MSTFRDHYFKMAKTEGYRARSAYKLIEANQKFHLIKGGDFILDLGTAPGSWLQVAAPIVGKKGLVVGVDIEPVGQFKELDNVKTSVLDVFDSQFEEKVLSFSRGKLFDVILSDAAPKTSGQKELDQERSLEIARRAFEISEKLLKTRGHVYVKVFEGPEVPLLIKEYKDKFKLLKIFKPAASKKGSKEIYLVGLEKI